MMNKEEKTDGAKILLEELTRPIYSGDLMRRAAEHLAEHLPKYAAAMESNKRAKDLFCYEYSALSIGNPFFLFYGDGAAEALEHIKNEDIINDELTFLLLVKAGTITGYIDDVAAIAQDVKNIEGRSLIDAAAILSLIMWASDDQIKSTNVDRALLMSEYWKIAPRVKYRFAYVVANNVLNASPEELEQIAAEYINILPKNVSPDNVRARLSKDADELHDVFLRLGKISEKTKRTNKRAKIADDTLAFYHSTLKINSAPLKYHDPDNVPSTGKITGTLTTWLNSYGGVDNLPSGATQSDVMAALNGVQNMLANGLFHEESQTGVRAARVTKKEFARYALEYDTPNAEDIKRVWDGLIVASRVKLMRGTDKRGRELWCFVVGLIEGDERGAILTVPPTVYKSRVTLLARETWEKLQGMNYNADSFKRFRNVLIYKNHKKTEDLLNDIFGYDDKIETAGDVSDEQRRKARRTITKNKGRDRAKLAEYFKAALNEGVITQYEETDGVYSWRRSDIKTR